MQELPIIPEKSLNDKIVFLKNHAKRCFFCGREKVAIEGPIFFNGRSVYHFVCKCGLSTGFYSEQHFNEMLFTWNMFSDKRGDQ